MKSKTVITDLRDRPVFVKSNAVRGDFSCSSDPDGYASFFQNLEGRYESKRDFEQELLKEFFENTQIDGKYTIHEDGVYVGHKNGHVPSRGVGSRPLVFEFEK